MPLMEWDESFSVNVVEIDGQHKVLVGMLNDLHDAMRQGKGKEILADVLRKLTAYAGYHFATEEKYMTQYGYPGYQLHKREHEKFVEKVKKFQDDFNAGKVLLTNEVMNFLKDWLVNHIKGTDKKMGLFLNEKGVK